MTFDIPEIERILNSVSEDTSTSDWEYNKGRCWESWVAVFFMKDDRHKKINQDLTLIERISIMEKFENTAQSEEDFKKLYPDYEYDVYKSPWDFNYRMVSEAKIQKIAFELQQHIPLEYNQLCSLVTTVLRRNKRERWVFDEVITNLMSFDKDLFLKATIYVQMKKQKLVA